MEIFLFGSHFGFFFPRGFYFIKLFLFHSCVCLCTFYVLLYSFKEHIVSSPEKAIFAAIR